MTIAAAANTFATERRIIEKVAPKRMASGKSQAQLPKPFRHRSPVQLLEQPLRRPIVDFVGEVQELPPIDDADADGDAVTPVAIDPQRWPLKLNWQRYLIDANPPTIVYVPTEWLAKLGADQAGSLVVVRVELIVNRRREVETMKLFDVKPVPGAVFARPAETPADGEHGWDLSKVKDPRVREVLEKIMAQSEPVWSLQQPDAPA